MLTKQVTEDETDEMLLFSLCRYLARPQYLRHCFQKLY